jgi:hypothetical protein
MENFDNLFLSLELSLALKEAGILLDETIAIRHKDNGSVSLTKSMFKVIPALHIKAPSTDELYDLIPKKIVLDEMNFFLMTSVDPKHNTVSWYESEEGNITDMITGDDLKTCLTNQIIFLIKSDIITSQFINRAEWA